MRKRSASESGTQTNKSYNEVNCQLSKLRKSRVTKPSENINPFKRKSSENSVSTNGKSDYMANDSSPVHKYFDGSSSQEMSLKRKHKSQHSFLDLKEKTDPLPDIMHDWEIIVKSLQPNSGQTEPRKAKPAKYVSPEHSSKSLKHEFADSDKENTALKKRCASYSTPKTSEKYNTSSASTSSIPRPKINGENIKLQKTPTHDSSSDDPEIYWKRPTRSTYKAFEIALDSSANSEQPSDGNVKSDSENDVESLKELLTPKRVTVSLERTVCVNSNIKTGSNCVKNQKTTNEKNFSSLKNARKRKFEETKSDDHFKDLSSDEDNDYIGFDDFPERSVSQKKCLNDSNDSELDFIGFGSPPQLPKSLLSKSKLFASKLDDKEIIEGEVLANETTPTHIFELNDSVNYLSDDKIDSQSVNSVSLEEINIEYDESEPDDCSSVLKLSTDFEKYFDVSHTHPEQTLDFEGFPNKILPGMVTCIQCKLVLGSHKILKKHIKVCHKRIYCCPFDLGRCGRFLGAFQLHKHILHRHQSLWRFLINNIYCDVENGKVAKWSNAVESCGVCLMPLEQPMRGLHEMLVHGIKPPSILSLAAMAVDQHVSVWWSGRSIVFACHLCYHSGNDNHTIPLISTSPYGFPTLISNHMRNVHLLNLPFILGWWLLIRLNLILPAHQRRTLSTLLALGTNSSDSYSHCVICSAPLSFYFCMNIKDSAGLCQRCQVLSQNKAQCWFQCDERSFSQSNVAFHHLMVNHKKDISGAWCPLCGDFHLNILVHVLNCKDSFYSNSCKFCFQRIDLTDMPAMILHSISSHNFPCPIPNCFLEVGHCSVRRYFPTSKALHQHLIGQHFPDFSDLKLEEISSIIHSSKKIQGLVLSEFSSQHLSKLWYNANGLRYSHNRGVISPIDTVKVSVACLFCFHKREEYLSYLSKEQSSLCSICSLAIEQSIQCDTPTHCPSFKCMVKIESTNHLIDHLTNIHKLEPLSNKCTCSYCGILSSASPIMSLTHNLLKHKIACLLCPYTAPTSAQIHAHWATMHGMPSWDAVFGYLKAEELNNVSNKSPKLPGIVKVWIGENGTEAQWDFPIDLNYLLSSPNSDVQQPDVIQQSYMQGIIPKFEVKEQGWCSSLCSVSMSPHKAPGAAVANTAYCEDGDNEEIEISPDLLIPNVSVGEANGQDGFNTQLETVDGQSSDSDSEPQLQIDTSESLDYQNPTSENCLTVKIPTNFPDNETEISNNEGMIQSNSTNSKTPMFGLVESLNSVMSQTIHSMNQALNLPGAKTVKGKKSKKKETKSLGDKAFVNIKSMGENILKDLEEKFLGTCVGCNSAIELPDLAEHIQEVHYDRFVLCTCGFKGDLCTVLVHSFHMSHLPNETRPIFCPMNNDPSDAMMIVLKPRSDARSMSYPCFKCSKRFKQEKSRQLHYNLCKLEKKFTCSLCGEKFALENHLLKHKEWKHNPQKCKYCNKDFNSSSSLIQHITHIHKEIGLYQHVCKVCGNTFKNSKQLKVHSRTHNGVKPYPCPLCNSTFTSEKQLQKHQQTDHQIISSSSIFNAKSNSSNDHDFSSDADSDTENQNSKITIPINVNSLSQPDLDTSDEEAVAKDKREKSKPGIESSGGTFDKSQTQQAAGIYKDHESVTLPPLRKELKAKISVVGTFCKPCGQEFDTTVGKLLHMYLIHPGLVISMGFHGCGFCQYKFSSAEDVCNHHLDKHQRTFLENGDFRCLCGLVFREEGAYYFHLYYAHKAQRALNVGGDIVCRLCPGKPKLNKIVDLVVHLSDRHTMFDHVRFNDSYMCNFCYKAFESWTVLSLHFFMVHKATKSQTLSYDCPYCLGASPWHSLEALQYHLDNVHRGRHTQSKPVPENSRSIYNPACNVSSPTKKSWTPKADAASSAVKKAKTNIKSKISKVKQKSPANQEELYCVCQCPYDEVSDMIGCDNPTCKYQWFHFECVGIMAAPEGNWFCPDCCAIAQRAKMEQKKKSKLQQDLYEYYNDLDSSPSPEKSSSDPSQSQNYSSSGSSSSNSSNSSSSNSSSSSSDSSSGSGDEN